MKRVSVTFLGGWCIFLLLMALVELIGKYVFDWHELALSTTQGLLLIGLLGILVDSTLKSHHRRISQLEHALSQRS